MTALHTPVLLQESVAALLCDPKGCYLEGTYGRGGHAREILRQLSPEGFLLSMDRDPEAAEAAAQLHVQSNFAFARSPFSQMIQVASSLGYPLGSFSGVLLDLGVSSPQLSDPLRGFSFMHSGPLDMRMDPTQGLSAAEWLLRATAAEIQEVLSVFGEEKFAHRIAQAIVARRRCEPLKTTNELVDLVSGCLPTRERKHPATRSFQAIRMQVNAEVPELLAGLNAAVQLLRPGGRLVVLTFHGVEDRVVKRFMRANAGRASEEMPPQPVAMPRQAQDRTLHALTKHRPTREEIQRNPRSRSAMMRVAIRSAAAGRRLSLPP